MKPDDAVSHVTLPPFKDLILKMSAEEIAMLDAEDSIEQARCLRPNLVL